MISSEKNHHRLEPILSIESHLVTSIEHVMTDDLSKLLIENKWYLSDSQLD